MAQNGNGDDRRAKLIGSVVAAVVTALVGGGAIGYQVKGGEAHAAPLVVPEDVRVTVAGHAKDIALLSQRMERNEARDEASDRVFTGFMVEVRTAINSHANTLEAVRGTVARIENNQRGGR